MWEPHSIDRFASVSTAQLEKYNSRYLDPLKHGVDALAQNDWATENNYVDPPFGLLDRVLDVIVRQRAHCDRTTLARPGVVSPTDSSDGCASSATPKHAQGNVTHGRHGRDPQKQTLEDICLEDP